MKNKGITLISLVITIIIMLILAAVTINLTIGERGIFKTASQAKENEKIAWYQEQIELARGEVTLNNMGEVTLDNLIEQIYTNKIVPAGYIEKLDEEKAQVTTNEGYIFIITADKTEYKGKGDILPPPDLTQENVTFILDPDSWTNGIVKVTIEHKEGEQFAIQYSTDSTDTKNWKDYTAPVELDKNTTIYACLKNIAGTTGNYAQYDIEKIDKLPPEQFTPTATATTNSITVNASGAKDSDSTPEYGSSGIKEIWYSKDNGVTWQTNEANKTQTNYTYTGLTQNTTYNIQVKVIDNAENPTITAKQEISTNNTVIAQGNIEIIPSTEEWTNGDVTVTASTTQAGYTVQISKTQNFPDTAIEVTSVTVSQNQTVYARIVDSTNQSNGIAQYDVEKIDKLPPEQFTPTVTATTNLITIDASNAKDAEATPEYGSSGIKEIWYSKDNGATWQTNEANKTQTNYTYTGLTQNTTYNIQVKVIDNVGNPTITANQAVKTKNTVIAQGNIEIIPSTEEWTKGDVTVTASTTQAGYTVQISKTTTFPDTAIEVKSVTVSQNQTVYARIVDSINQSNGIAQYDVENIDKTSPTITNVSATPTSATITASDNVPGSGVTLYAVTSNATAPADTAYTGNATITGLAQNTTYYAWAKDKVGNVSEAKSFKTQIQLVTGITLNKTSTTIKKGKTETLTATIAPDNANNKNVTWSSSNNAIATVSNGTITGLAPGTVTIIATAQDGSGKSASCSVTIDNANDTTINRTIDGKAPSYQNPTIPAGFDAIDTPDATWNKDNGASSQWNNGLVIRNLTDGNEFVWVPVDGTNVKYEKWCTTGVSYSNCTDLASTSGLDVKNNVTKYGGFWVARYEAGLPTNINQTTANSSTRNVAGKPLSKLGAVPWNYINWNNSKANAESMYSNNYVQSGLVNGTQWDTIMKWVQNGGKDVTSSLAWGNYNNTSVALRSPYQFISTDHGASWTAKTATDKDAYNIIKTGASDQTKAKNMYDLAGNMMEWTDEWYSSRRVVRGGFCGFSSSTYTAGASRSFYDAADPNNAYGFRAQLYIK